MAGLWAWPLLLWVTLAGHPPHALVRQHKEPCDDTPTDSVAACHEDLAEYQKELSECESTLADLEAHSDSERETLRAEWQAVNEEVAQISEQVTEKETELDELEAANKALHAKLIESLGQIGLLQVNRTDPELDTQKWLACLDEKTSVELKASSCKLTIRTTTLRMTSQRQHYTGLKDAAAQNKAMVASRLSIVQQMIDSATARNIKLTEQVAQIQAITGTSFAVVGKTRRDVRVRDNTTTEEHRARARKDDPLAEAKARLQTIDAEIAAMRNKVELSGQVRDALRDSMARESKVQGKVAGKLRKVKEQTMTAFRKAFELDLQLDQLEALHDDAYVATRNATAAWEAAARAEHTAVAELQTLVTQKHRYEAVVRGAEDPARLEDGMPAWAREEKEPRAHAAAAGVFAALLFARLC